MSTEFGDPSSVSPYDAGTIGRIIKSDLEAAKERQRAKKDAEFQRLEQMEANGEFVNIYDARLMSRVFGRIEE